MSKAKGTRKEGYPLPGYEGHTTDAEHCPRCGSEEFALIGGSLIQSGQRIGICRECGENFIVEPMACPQVLDADSAI